MGKRSFILICIKCMKQVCLKLNIVLPLIKYTIVYYNKINSKMLNKSLIFQHFK